LVILLMTKLEMKNLLLLSSSGSLLELTKRLTIGYSCSNILRKSTSVGDTGTLMAKHSSLVTARCTEYWTIHGTGFTLAPGKSTLFKP
jgi:hypothetical protein